MNFIIDLGGVVVTWRPEQLVAEHFDDPMEQMRVSAGFIGHDDWVALDRGTLSRQVAIERAVERTGIARNKIASLLQAVPDALVAIPETVALLYHLKAKGHHLYCLSNMHHDFIAHLERTYTFWEVFSDIVVSCRVQMCKPELAIFTHLLTKHALNPAETLFIDDTPVNLTAAASLGIQTLQFEHPAQCGAYLESLSYI